MPGLLPMPDSIKGCGPECLRDSDCHYDLICDYRIQRCIEKPNQRGGRVCHLLPRVKCKDDKSDEKYAEFNLQGVCLVVPSPDTLNHLRQENQIKNFLWKLILKCSKSRFVMISYFIIHRAP